MAKIVAHKEVFENIIGIQFMVIEKAKASAKGRNAFYAGFLYIKINCTFVKSKSFSYNVIKG